MYKLIESNFLINKEEIIFFIFSIIECFIILPLKWVFTGKYSVSQTNWFGRFGVSWYNKITNRHW